MASRGGTKCFILSGFTHIAFGIGLLIRLAAFWLLAAGATGPAEAEHSDARASATRPAAVDLLATLTLPEPQPCVLVLVSSEEDALFLRAFASGSTEHPPHIVVVRTPEDVDQQVQWIGDVGALGTAAPVLLDLRREPPS